MRKLLRLPLTFVLILIISTVGFYPPKSTEAKAENQGDIEPSNADTSQAERDEQIDVQSLLQEIQEKEGALEARTRRLDEKEQELTSLQNQIEQKIEKLNEAEVRLREISQFADALPSTNIGQISSVFENMTPDEAASLVGEFDPQVSAELLRTLEATKISQILSIVEPNLAKNIILLMLTRNQNLQIPG